MAEGIRQKIIQVQHPVGSTDERTGNPSVKGAEHAVFPLGEPLAETAVKTRLPGTGRGECKRYRQAADAQVTAPVSCLHEAVGKAPEYSLVRKCNRNIQNQIFRMYPDTRSETGQPPVAAADGK